MVFARVINVCDPSLFNIIVGKGKDLKQFEDYHNYLEKLATRLIKRKSDHDFKKGDLVLGKCSLIGDKWTNGILGDLFCSGEWEVTFEMCSTTEVVNISDIINCPQDFLKQKHQATFTSCSLDGIATSGKDDGHRYWSEESLAYFNKHVKDKRLVLTSMKQKKKFYFVDFLVKCDDGQSRSLRNLMDKMGYLKPLKKSQVSEAPRGIQSQGGSFVATISNGDKNGIHGNQAKGESSLSSKDFSLSENDLEYICMLMKVTKEDYFSILEYENKPYDPSLYPPIEQLISDALSANRAPPLRNHHKANDEPAIRRETKSMDQISRSNGDVVIGQRNRVRSEKIGDDFEERIEEILSKESNQLYEILNFIGIGDKMISSQVEESKVVRCLQVLVSAYITHGNHKKLCMLFISQIAGRSKHALKIWNDTFWTIYDKVISTKDLNEDHLTNFSCFMADTCALSKFLEYGLSDSMMEDLLLALKNIVDKTQEDINTPLANFITNFLLQISKIKRNKQFQSEIVDMLLSSRLSANLLAIFLSLLDVDVVKVKSTTKLKNNDSHLCALPVSPPIILNPSINHSKHVEDWNGDLFD